MVTILGFFHVPATSDKKIRNNYEAIRIHGSCKSKAQHSKIHHGLRCIINDICLRKAWWFPSQLCLLEKSDVQEFSMENHGGFLASYVWVSNLQEFRIPSKVFWRFLIFGLDDGHSCDSSPKVPGCWFVTPPNVVDWWWKPALNLGIFLDDLFVQKSNSTGWNPKNEGGWFRCFSFSIECFWGSFCR